MAEDLKPSVRRALADKLKESIADFSATSVVSGPFLVSLQGKKVYQLTLQISTYSAALINVYASDFIQVDYKVGGRTDNPVFNNSLTALSFVKQALILGFWDKASKIPVKEGTGNG